MELYFIDGEKPFQLSRPKVGNRDMIDDRRGGATSGEFNKPQLPPMMRHRGRPQNVHAIKSRVKTCQFIYSCK